MVLLSNGYIVQQQLASVKMFTPIFQQSLWNLSPSRVQNSLIMYIQIQAAEFTFVGTNNVSPPLSPLVQMSTHKKAPPRAAYNAPLVSQLNYQISIGTFIIQWERANNLIKTPNKFAMSKPFPSLICISSQHV